MNWFNLTLIAGIVLTILGIIFIITGSIMAAIIFLLIGAAFLALDYSPESNHEFSGISRDVLIKKILGIVVLIGAGVLFILEVGKNMGFL
jgi:hypothetical protein